MAGTGERRPQLQDAARISGDDEVRLQRGDVIGFAITQFRGGFGLDEIVDSRRTTAESAFGDFQQLQIRNLLEQRAGL